MQLSSSAILQRSEVCWTAARVGKELQGMEERDTARRVGSGGAVMRVYRRLVFTWGLGRKGGWCALC